MAVLDPVRQDLPSGAGQQSSDAHEDSAGHNRRAQTTDATVQIRGTTKRPNTFVEDATPKLGTVSPTHEVVETVIQRVTLVVGWSATLWGRRGARPLRADWNLSRTTRVRRQTVVGVREMQPAVCQVALRGAAGRQKRDGALLLRDGVDEEHSEHCPQDRGTARPRLQSGKLQDERGSCSGVATMEGSRDPRPHKPRLRRV